MTFYQNQNKSSSKYGIINKIVPWLMSVDRENKNPIKNIVMFFFKFDLYK